MATAQKPSANRASTPALGEGFSRAFEFAATPAIFGGIGYLVDRALGTKPFLMIGLTLFAVVGMFVRMWLQYDAAMKVEEARTLAARAESDARHRASVADEFGVEDVNAVAEEAIAQAKATTDNSVLMNGLAS